MQTKVQEREQAKIVYDDAMASGQTAVISYTSSTDKTKSLLRVMLGNFPPLSKAHLKV